MSIEKQVSSLLQRAKDIQNMGTFNTFYASNSNYVNDVDIWINDVDIFYQRYLQNHPLRKRIQSLIFHRTKSCFQELISCLQSISRDNYFFDKENVEMKEYEKFLKKCIESLDKNNPYHRIFQYEMKGDDRAIIEKLKNLGYIANVTYMGIKHVGFDITYDGIHYFDELNEGDSNNDTDRGVNLTFEEITDGKDDLIKYDLFLSHASKDKISFVEELKQVLDQLGILIFYDKDSIEWGDKWKEKILEGVAQSEFAIIVISENFFGREWTEKELSEFLNRQNSSGQKIILPILFNVTVQQLESRYPDLADIQAIVSSDHSKEEIALLFARQYIKRIRNIRQGRQ